MRKKVRVLVELEVDPIIMCDNISTSIKDGVKYLLESDKDEWSEYPYATIKSITSEDTDVNTYYPNSFYYKAGKGFKDEAEYKKWIKETDNEKVKKRSNEKE
jgi:hypothetical protein